MNLKQQICQTLLSESLLSYFSVSREERAEEVPRPRRPVFLIYFI